MENANDMESVLKKNIVPIAIALISFTLSIGGIYYEFKDMKSDQVASEQAHKAEIDELRREVVELKRQHVVEMDEVKKQLWGELEQRTDDLEEYLAWLDGKEGRSKH